jgi:glutamate synthase domain-containing protein 3
VASCNGELAMERYEQYGLTMRQWWQVAVDLTGVKGYYCTDFVRGDMTVVGGSGDE